MTATLQSKLAVAKQACKALRELDKVSLCGDSVPGYSKLRQQTLDLIHSLGYTVEGDPWKLVKADK